MTHLRRSSRSFSSRFPHPTSAPSGHLLPEKGGSIHASPFSCKGLPSAARRGWLSFSAAKPPPLCLPLWGKVLCREKRYPRIVAFPIGEGGPRQRWIGCSRIMAHLRRSLSLSFIPLPTSNLCPFGAPPSRGRREYPREPLLLEGAAERSEAGLVSFFGGEAVTFISDFNFSFVQSFRTRSRDGMPHTYYQRTNE